ncbi:AlpA family phage regulatory protein [Devosia chinhatensis]|uniref:helix-turn-helix transcriptional regulator n=1 Tax=Devosia chinhatensis TaxID=429727 RepID=UPI000A04087D
MYLSDKQLAERFSIKRTSVWRWVKVDPSFPRPIRLTAKCTRWRETEILAWEKSREGAA